MGTESSHDAPKPLRPARSVERRRRGQDDGPPPAPGGASDAKPTPVRDGVPPAMGGESDAGREPVAESTSLELGDVTWTVRVRGRGRAGAETGPAPLLVLGFFRRADADVPEREALVVARSLEDLTVLQLERAFDVSHPPPDPDERKELFPETATKGRKGNR